MLPVPERVVDQVVEDPLDERIDEDLGPSYITQEGKPRPPAAFRGVQECFPDILPDGFLEADVLVVPGKLHLEPDDVGRLLHVVEIAGNRGVRGPEHREVEIAGERCQLVKDIVARDIREQDQFPVCRLEGILRIPLVGDIVEVPDPADDLVADLLRVDIELENPPVPEDEFCSDNLLG